MMVLAELEARRLLVLPIIDLSVVENQPLPPFAASNQWLCHSKSLGAS